MARNIHQFPHLARIHQEINTLFERFMDRSAGAAMDAWDPPVDVFQKGEHLHLRVDLPGIEKRDIALLIRGDNLVIRGQKRPHRYPQSALVCFHCMETTHGHFEKSVHLGHSVDARTATARLKDGVLSIRLPVIRDRRGSEIEITVDGEP